jgi:SAM-dependent methyltransferase
MSISFYCHYWKTDGNLQLMRSVDFKSQFWNAKILNWEASRYFCTRGLSKTRLNSVKKRLDLTSQILSQHAKGKSLLELGCGSGVLLSSLDRQDFTSWSGIDISPTAISKAQQRLKGLASFTQGDVTTCSLPQADCVIALGLLDWLSLSEIQDLASRLNSTHFLFSFSERKFSIVRMLHQIYTFFSYGIWNSFYVPKYWTEKEIRDALSPLNRREFPITFIRDPDLSFGCLVTNLT